MDEPTPSVYDEPIGPADLVNWYETPPDQRDWAAFTEANMVFALATAIEDTDREDDITVH